MVFLNQACKLNIVAKSAHYPAPIFVAVEGHWLISLTFPPSFNIASLIGTMQRSYRKQNRQQLVALTLLLTSCIKFLEDSTEMATLVKDEDALFQ
jgi:hypothetical protein